jgi:putative two-component system response regulator
MMQVKTKILAVEDEAVVRTNVATYLEDSGYDVYQAENGLTGWDQFEKYNPDLVLLDLKMPVMTGVELLDKITTASPDTPIIIVSGTGSIKDAISALKAGAWDYITKPIQEMEVLEYSIKKSLERSYLIKENRMYSKNLESLIEKRTFELKERTKDLEQINELYKKEIRERIFAEDKLVESFGALEKTIDGTIQTISYIGELRDSYTAGHQQRVALLAQAIARELTLSSEQIKGVYVSGMLHDIGKIAIPLEILCKPNNLSELDMQYIRIHPQAGYDILEKIKFPWPVAQYVLQHHERLDGSGYPLGLIGEYILPESKIIAVADVVESIASHRPYRGSLGIDAALKEITSKSGTAYDERVVSACVKLFIEKKFSYE